LRIAQENLKYREGAATPSHVAVVTMDNSRTAFGEKQKLRAPGDSGVVRTGILRDTKANVRKVEVTQPDK
jgi:hypothetical protein